MPITETLAMLITANGAEALTVIDDLQAKLVKLDAKSAESGKMLGAAVTVGAVVAGAALVDMLAKGSAALKEQQVIGAQTDAVLLSTGDAANVTAGHVSDLAAKISGYSGQTIDAVKQTENLLLTFDGIKNVGTAKVFDMTTTAVFDMAQALGEDATTAALQLGKALQNPEAGLGRLARVGIQFTAQEKEQIKTLQEHGDVAQAQVVILDRVFEKFGGSAKAYGDTTAGELDKVHNSIVELEKALAAPLASAPVRDTLQAIVDVTDKLNSHPIAEDVAAGAIGLAAAWALVNKAVLVFQDAFPGVVSDIAGEGAAASVAAGEVQTLAAAEVEAGAAFDVAGAEASFAAIGTAAAGATGVVSRLLKMLGSPLAEIAVPAAAAAYGAYYLGKTGADVIKNGQKYAQWMSSGSSGGSPGDYPPPGAVFGGPGNYAVRNPDGTMPAPASSGNDPSSRFYNWGTGVNNPGTTLYAQGAAGLGTSDAGQVLDWAGTGAAGLGTSDSFAGAPVNIPATPKAKGGGGGGSSALATLNAQDTLAGLFGLTPAGIAAALNEGVVTGKSPLNDLMTQAGSLLTGTAKTIVGNLASILSSAIAFGQAAQKSLQFSLTGAPQMGTITDITVGPNGQLTSQVQSPVLGQLQQTLATDQRFAGDIGKLKKLGLNSDILGQLISGGPSQLASADALANSTPSDIAAINATDNQVNLLSQQYGQAVTQTQYLGQAVNLLQQLLAALPGSITKTSLVQHNATAAQAQLQARTVPSKGVHAR